MDLLIHHKGGRGMKRRPYLLLSLLLVVLLLLPSFAGAEPLSKPNGPWITDNQAVQLNSTITKSS